MTLEQLVQRVETRLLDLSRRLWKPDPLGPFREEVAGAADEVRRHRATLTRCQDDLAETRRRLTYNQTAVALLTSRIEACLQKGTPERAWQYALELDKLRKAAAEDQALLPKQEQACWSLEFKLRQLERRLTVLQEELAGRQASRRG
jgi:hypothetical protein